MRNLPAVGGWVRTSTSTITFERVVRDGRFGCVTLASSVASTLQSSPLTVLNIDDMPLESDSCYELVLPKRGMLTLKTAHAHRFCVLP